jgi:hypothetical protein
MYHIAGPGSPSVLTNMITSIEQHVDWIADTIKDLDARGIKSIEATQEAQDAWVQHVNTVAGYSIYPSCASWYLVRVRSCRSSSTRSHLSFDSGEQHSRQTAGLYAAFGVPAVP